MEVKKVLNNNNGVGIKLEGRSDLFHNSRVVLTYDLTNKYITYVFLLLPIESTL